MSSGADTDAGVTGSAGTVTVLGLARHPVGEETLGEEAEEGMVSRDSSWAATLGGAWITAGANTGEEGAAVTREGPY